MVDGRNRESSIEYLNHHCVKKRYKHNIHIRDRAAPVCKSSDLIGVGRGGRYRMSSFLACRRFLHNKGVADTGTSEKSEVAGSIITRGMRQASNRAAKTVISLQCWDQESERGAVISAVLATTTILLYKIAFV